jgi:cation diffusion facilitator family transporter
MHSHSIARWTHDHAFLGEHHRQHERRTWSVVTLTALMMVAEITGGTLFGSMALIADGWHMATHVAALAIAGLAYLFARRHADNARFSLGTGKFGELAAFASAIILGMIAIGIGYESILRLLHPIAIRYQDAIPIAGLGLAVNLASAWLLQEDHHHGHDHAREPSDPANHDTNLRAAYVHVLADALTSVLAIVGLSVAWLLGWSFVDPLVALIGTGVIASWAFGLVRTAGGVLLDSVPDPGLAQRIRGLMEIDGDRVTDLHVWQLGPGHAAVIASVVSDRPQSPSFYKQRLDKVIGLSHVTVEVQACSH